MAGGDVRRHGLPRPSQINQRVDLKGLGYRVLRLVWEDLYDEQAPATIGRLAKLLPLRGV